MSDDLYLLRKDEADLAAAYERLEEAEEREPTAADEQRLRQLAADLQAASPGLDVSEPQVGFGLQLGYESERPVVIDIYAGSITMSWSYGADDAAPAVAEVERYLPVFERHGYVAYDPQLERAYVPSRDRDEAAEIHRHVREQVFENPGTPDGRSSWWKRLFRSH
jgi:hypothetical protein